LFSLLIRYNNNNNIKLLYWKRSLALPRATLYQAPANKLSKEPSAIPSKIPTSLLPSKELLVLLQATLYQARDLAQHQGRSQVTYQQNLLLHHFPCCSG
jgi:hypothetical protein